MSLLKWEQAYFKNMIGKKNFVLLTIFYSINFSYQYQSQANFVFYNGTFSKKIPLLLFLETFVQNIINRISTLFNIFTYENIKIFIFTRVLYGKGLAERKEFCVEKITENFMFQFMFQIQFRQFQLLIQFFPQIAIM